MSEYGYYNDDERFDSLLGKTLTSVVIDKEGDIITFTAADGDVFVMGHSQDCCESVGINDVNGDVEDLVGNPILFAEESTSGTPPEGVEPYNYESQTWTFYRIGTVKGTVVLRWLGTSNGYYSEGVSFGKKKGND